MPGKAQPLVDNQRIVTADGLPTQYFIRWAQERQIDISTGITAAEAQQLIDDWAASRSILAGVALHGGGTLAADRTIDHDDALVTPGTYGSATKVPRFVVDAQGHIQGVTEVPVSGGGGGGSDLLGYAYAHTDVNVPSNTTALGALIPDLTVTFNMDADGLIQVQWSMLARRDSQTDRILMLMDGAHVPSANISDSNYYLWDQGENSVFSASGTQIYPCTAGAHTFQLNYADAKSINSTRFWDRMLTVRKIA